MEERVARLEANVEHIQADVSEVKQDVRRLDAKIDAFRVETNESFTALRVGRALDKVWWLLIAAALLGVMAKGFKWI